MMNILEFLEYMYKVWTFKLFAYPKKRKQDTKKNNIYKKHIIR